MSNITFALVSVLFTVGFFLHVLKAASRGIDHGVSCTRTQWFQKYWYAVLIRWVMALVFFLLYTSSPDIAAKLFAWASFVPTMSLPITKCTSLILGYFADSALDLVAKKIPFINREIPRTDGELN